MEIGQIDPELRPAMARVPRFNLQNPIVLRGVGMLSRMAPGKRTPGVRRDKVRAHGARLRVFVPERRSGAALLWIHGGGLVMGAAATDDAFCGDTAAQTGAVVVSVDYRLAPAHPFPAAIDDSRAGWRWLHRHASELGVDPQRIAVGGQSAGGGLAACLVQRLRDEGEHVAAQWLFCPMLDDRTARDRGLDREAHLIWSNRSNLAGWRAYLGALFGAESLPDYAAAARRADLSGLPPTWLYVTAIELFHNEVADYAARLRAADVEVELVTVDAAPHGFEAWAPQTAKAATLVGGARTWLSAALE